MSDEIRERFDIFLKQYCKSHCRDKVEGCLLGNCINQSDFDVFRAGHRSRDEEVLQLTSRVAVAEGENAELEAENLEHQGIIEILGSYINNSLWSTQDLVEEISKLKQSEGSNDKAEHLKAEIEEYSKTLTKWFDDTQLYFEVILKQKEESGQLEAEIKVLENVIQNKSAENKKLREACILANKALRNIELVDRVKAEEAIAEALKDGE